jgi:hypothetical protein
MQFLDGMSNMKKLILAIVVSVFSISAQAVIVTEPPKNGIAPRANAPGSGYSPPEAAQKTQTPAKPVQAKQPVPAYIENGRPVYPNAAPAANICHDANGNVIKCAAQPLNPAKNQAAKPVRR